MMVHEGWGRWLGLPARGAEAVTVWTKQTGWVAEDAALTTAAESPSARGVRWVLEQVDDCLRWWLQAVMSVQVAAASDSESGATGRAARTELVLGREGGGWKVHHKGERRQERGAAIEGEHATRIGGTQTLCVSSCSVLLNHVLVPAPVGWVMAMTLEMVGGRNRERLAERLVPSVAADGAQRQRGNAWMDLVTAMAVVMVAVGLAFAVVLRGVLMRLFGKAYSSDCEGDGPEDRSAAVASARVLASAAAEYLSEQREGGNEERSLRTAQEARLVYPRPAGLNPRSTRVSLPPPGPNAGLEHYGENDLAAGEVPTDDSETELQERELNPFLRRRVVIVNNAYDQRRLDSQDFRRNVEADFTALSTQYGHLLRVQALRLRCGTSLPFNGGVQLKFSDERSAEEFSKGVDGATWRYTQGCTARRLQTELCDCWYDTDSDGDYESSGSEGGRFAAAVERYEVVRTAESPDERKYPEARRGWRAAMEPWRRRVRESRADWEQRDWEGWMRERKLAMRHMRTEQRLEWRQVLEAAELLARRPEECVDEPREEAGTEELQAGRLAREHAETKYREGQLELRGSGAHGTGELNNVSSGAGSVLNANDMGEHGDISGANDDLSVGNMGERDNDIPSVNDDSSAISMDECNVNAMSANGVLNVNNKGESTKVASGAGDASSPAYSPCSSHCDASWRALPRKSSVVHFRGTPDPAIDYVAYSPAEAERGHASRELEQRSAARRTQRREAQRRREKALSQSHLFKRNRLERDHLDEMSLLRLETERAVKRARAGVFCSEPGIRERWVSDDGLDGLGDRAQNGRCEYPFCGRVSKQRCIACFDAVCYEHCSPVNQAEPDSGYYDTERAAPHYFRQSRYHCDYCCEYSPSYCMLDPSSAAVQRAYPGVDQEVAEYDDVLIEAAGCDGAPDEVVGEADMVVARRRGMDSGPSELALAGLDTYESESEGGVEPGLEPQIGVGSANAGAGGTRAGGTGEPDFDASRYGFERVNGMGRRWMHILNAHRRSFEAPLGMHGGGRSGEGRGFGSGGGFAMRRVLTAAMLAHGAHAAQPLHEQRTISLAAGVCGLAVVLWCCLTAGAAWHGTGVAGVARWMGWGRREGNELRGMEGSGGGLQSNDGRCGDEATIIDGPQLSAVSAGSEGEIAGDVSVDESLGTLSVTTLGLVAREPAVPLEGSSVMTVGTERTDVTSSANNILTSDDISNPDDILSSGGALGGDVRALLCQLVCGLRAVAGVLNLRLLVALLLVGGVDAAKAAIPTPSVMAVMATMGLKLAATRRARNRKAEPTRQKARVKTWQRGADVHQQLMTNERRRQAESKERAAAESLRSAAARTGRRSDTTEEWRGDDMRVMRDGTVRVVQLNGGGVRPPDLGDLLSSDVEVRGLLTWLAEIGADVLLLSDHRLRKEDEDRWTRLARECWDEKVVIRYEEGAVMGASRLGGVLVAMAGLAVPHVQGSTGDPRQWGRYLESKTLGANSVAVRWGAGYRPCKHTSAEGGGLWKQQAERMRALQKEGKVLGRKRADGVLAPVRPQEGWDCLEPDMGGDPGALLLRDIQQMGDGACGARCASSKPWLILGADANPGGAADRVSRKQLSDFEEQMGLVDAMQARWGDKLSWTTRFRGETEGEGTRPDRLWVSAKLVEAGGLCAVGVAEGTVLARSDHRPIVADFDCDMLFGVKRATRQKTPRMRPPRMVFRSKPQREAYLKATTERWDGEVLTGGMGWEASMRERRERLGSDDAMNKRVADEAFSELLRFAREVAYGVETGGRKTKGTRPRDSRSRPKRSVGSGYGGKKLDQSARKWNKLRQLITARNRGYSRRYCAQLVKEANDLGARVPERGQRSEEEWTLAMVGRAKILRRMLTGKAKAEARLSMNNAVREREKQWQANDVSRMIKALNPKARGSTISKLVTKQSDGEGGCCERVQQDPSEVARTCVQFGRYRFGAGQPKYFNYYDLRVGHEVRWRPHDGGDERDGVVKAIEQNSTYRVEGADNVAEDCVPRSRIRLPWESVPTGECGRVDETENRAPRTAGGTAILMALTEEGDEMRRRLAIGDLGVAEAGMPAEFEEIWPMMRAKVVQQGKHKGERVREEMFEEYGVIGADGHLADIKLKQAKKWFKQVKKAN